MSILNRVSQLKPIIFFEFVVDMYLKNIFCNLTNNNMFFFNSFFISPIIDEILIIVNL